MNLAQNNKGLSVTPSYNCGLNPACGHFMGGVDQIRHAIGLENVLIGRIFKPCFENP